MSILLIKTGADARTRTADLLMTNHLITAAHGALLRIRKNSCHHSPPTAGQTTTLENLARSSKCPYRVKAIRRSPSPAHGPPSQKTPEYRLPADAGISQSLVFQS